MIIGINTLCKGSAYTICELVKDGTHVLHRFVKQLTPVQRSGIMALITRVADYGNPENETRFIHEEDGIYAFKDGQVRVYCFFDKGRIIILTNGDIKKKNKADPSELKKAKKLRKAYKAYMEGTS
jgi:hypothetical protein